MSTKKVQVPTSGIENRAGSVCSTEDSCVDALKITFALWPVWITFLILGSLPLILKALERWIRSLQRIPSAEELESISGADFESFLRMLLERDGWKVELTPKSGDFGADLVIRRHGKKAVVQAKRWRKPVGVRAVQEALAARDLYRADDAWVITNSVFSKAAYRQAEASRITLHDGEWLARKIGELRREAA